MVWSCNTNRPQAAAAAIAQHNLLCHSLKTGPLLSTGWGGGGPDLQAAVEALLRGDAASLPDGVATALPAALPPLAFTAASTEAEGAVLQLPSAELRAWLPAWAAESEGPTSQGAAAE